MSGHQPFNQLRNKLSPTQLQRVDEQRNAIEQEIARLELETAIKSSASTWQPNVSVSAIDNIDDCLTYLRSMVNALGGELNITAKFPNDVEVSIHTLKK
jgi:hypothetical protein